MRYIHPWQFIFIVILAAALYFYRRKTAGQGVASGAATKAKATPESVYMDLRRQAIETNPKRLVLPDGLKAEAPYGALMEMVISNSTVTLACLADGDARVLYNTGGGMVGGVSHEPVRQAAKEFVALAQKALPGMTKTTTYPTPGVDKVRFYALTRRGVFTTETDRQALGNRRSDLSSLYASGQEVVAQMRQVQEQKAQDAQPAPRVG
jgi:hypothetical protein